MRKHQRTALYIRLSGALVAVASSFPVCATTDANTNTTTNAVSAYERFEAILKRAPFGPPPPVKSTGGEDANDITEEQVVQDPVQPLSAVVRLNAITRYNGIPAAGFVDKETNASYFLSEGQTIDDYTLDEVLFSKSSIVLIKGGQTEEIVLSFASGQPTNIVPIAGTKFLTALDFRKNSESDSLEATEVEEKPQGTDPTSEVESGSGVSPEIVEAATDTKDGEQKLSFRELHRLRIQEQRRKEELEKQQEEEKILKDKEISESLEKEKKLAEAALAAAEALHRSRMIEAIKAGLEVDEGFELTVEEAKALAEDGFAIPDELLAHGSEEASTETLTAPTP